MKKMTRNVILLTAAAVAGMYAYNRYVEATSTKKNLLKSDEGNFFKWKHGSIYYTKKGSGSPILLIHDMDATASSYEWNKIENRLARTNTVYTIDLLGCGRSDKPEIEYTNYLYVQLVTSFIKEINGKQVDVITSNQSAPFVIMANHMEKDLFEKIILINPVSLKQLRVIPDEMSKIKKNLINLPILGTFIYNIMTHPNAIDANFRDKYFEKESSISLQLEDTYYESAHLGSNGGKYLFSSMLGNYTNLDIRHALKALDKPLYIVSGRTLQNNIYITEEYKMNNKMVDVLHLSSASLYPHLETPDKTLTILESLLSK